MDSGVHKVEALNHGRIDKLATQTEWGVRRSDQGNLRADVLRNIDVFSD